MLLSEAFEAYRTGYVVYAQSHKTEEQLICARNSFIKYTGDIEMENLTIDHIRKWLYHLSQSGISPSTIKGYGEKLKVVLRYHPGYLDPGLILLPKRETKTPEWLTPKQVTGIINRAGCPKRKGCSKADKLRLQCIIATLYATGLRVNELCNISIQDINEDTISIVGKNKKPRLVFLDGRSKYLIAEYLKTRKDNYPTLFISNSKSRLTPGRIQESFRALSKYTGIDCHPHMLRHSFATNLLKNNCHVYTLSRMMGHSNISTTAIYMHIVDKELEEAHKKYHTI